MPYDACDAYVIRKQLYISDEHERALKATWDRAKGFTVNNPMNDWQNEEPELRPLANLVASLQDLSIRLSHPSTS
jgi:hypothetical protein